jgi:pimeloyl-ACP methyl ester carboxylesterase
MSTHPPKAQGWNRTSDSLLEYYESQLLRHLSAPHMVYQLPLRGDEFINTLEIIHPRRRPHTTPVVVIHGFASALATFVNVLQALSETHANVYAIDLPGFGRSWKPRFPSDNRDAEDLLVESIELWRVQMGIGAMILCAHSFGAYIATRYAHRYPTAAALVLFEPWGFQTKPPTQSQWPLCLVNPLMLLRLAGPMGLPLMRMATRALFQDTFAGIGEGDEMLLYLYHCNVQCTGDAAFRSLSGPSYLPLRPATPARNTTVIYGAESWVGAEDFSDIPDVVTEIVPGAGHQIYADQFEPFMAAVARALERTVN